jgi:hypothetical protein
MVGNQLFEEQGEASQITDHSRITRGKGRQKECALVPSR